MFTVSRRRGFTLRDMFVAIVVISILLALLIPALNQSRCRNYPYNACINNMRQVGLAIHIYHDVYKKFPVIADQCSNLFEQQLGYGSGPNADCTMAQYSWIVRILPYIEESAIYNEISADSNRFKTAAFDPSLQQGGNVDPLNVHFSQIQLATLLCPLAPSNYSDNRPPAQNYANVGVSTDRDTGQPVGVALTNYVAIAATHKERLKAAASDPASFNSVITSGKAKTLASISDGTEFTVMLAESKETTNSSWYDSSGTWIVALLPRQDLPPDLQPADFPMPDRTSLRTALNVGPTDREPDGYGAGLPATILRRWGPSSDHAGEIVMHCFVDNSVRAIKADIDPLVYAAIVTPNGGESVARADISAK